MNVGIYIYDDAEVLDFSGPFEVFSTASRLSGVSNAFKVFLIGETGNTVIARGGFSLIPTYNFSNHLPIDVLIVTGGMHMSEMKKSKVLTWIKEEASKAKIVASVCTGAFLLAEAGVLTNQKTTTHWEDIPSLRNLFPNLEVIEKRRWVEEGKVITSGGISAGIDMSLYIVSKLTRKELAVKTANQMEFNWTLNT